MTFHILLAGFGGQGLLFAGKQLALAAMNKGKFVTWLPSYGPEMRGGTANCSVIISDSPIGSPLVGNPDILIAMNRPSYEKFEKSVPSGGLLIYDSSMIEKESHRTDLEICAIPATAIAEQEDLKGLANVIILGKLLREREIFDRSYFEKSITEGISAAKAHLSKANLKALALGYEYQS